MRSAYLDAFAGVSGDMFLAALIDAGASVELLQETLASLRLGATLEVRRVNRSGIEATKADIRVGGELAEVAAAPANGHAQEHKHEHGGGHHDHEHDHHHDHHHEHEHEHAPHHKHQHRHDHRAYAEIRSLIEASQLPAPVKEMSLRAFQELALAESKIHGIAVESVHFHEVGAVDAIADIVLTATAVHALGIDAWHAAPVNVGGGTVDCAHGRFPVPAPATARLLLGMPTYAAGPTVELTTPTGAALLRALDCTFGPQPSMRMENIGYGAGGRDPAGFANVLRISIGSAVGADTRDDVVTILETAVDDMNPQILAYVADKALELGAFDVLRTPVQMKKGRSGTLITVLCAPEMAGTLQDLLLRETSSIGLRAREERRFCLPREFVPVETPWGQVRIKVARHEGKEWNATPEFEDCRQLAERHAVPLKTVMSAAVQVYRATKSTA